MVSGCLACSPSCSNWTIEKKVTFWGTRDSLATPDPETVRFGDNTSCEEATTNDGRRDGESS